MRLMENGIDGRVGLGLLCGLALVALAGCQQNEPNGTAGITAVSAASVPEPELNLTANSGVPVTPGAPVDPTVLAGSRRFGSRPDPFALLGPEIQFQNDQTIASYMSNSGGFALEINPEEDSAEPENPPVLEPVPAWRLSGVIIGNGVMALLDTGQRVYEIRPGMLIPGTDWRVAAIDSERALMVREPGSNKLPSSFEVTLQGPVGGGLAPTGGGNAGGGAGGRPSGGGGGTLGPAGTGG